MMRDGAISNSCAYGMFSKEFVMKEGKSFKDKKKELAKKERELKLGDHQFLVGHNRLSTTGTPTNNKNNHPIETKNWIVVHNGVLNNDKEVKRTFGLDYDEEVDSAVIPHLLEYNTTIERNSLDAVRETAEQLEGTFSVMAYSKKDDKLYYFKERSTNFYFGLVKRKDGNVILGSTTEEWLENAYVEYDMIFPINSFNDKVIVEAAEEVIYVIDENGIREVDTFVESYSSSPYFGRSKTTYDITDWEDQYPQIDDFLEIVETDLMTVYGLNSRQRDYRAGTIWFRCSSMDLADKVKDTYYFARRTKKGVSMTFEDIWEFLSTRYNIKETLERKQLKKVGVEVLREKTFVDDYSYRDPYELMDDYDSPKDE